MVFLADLEGEERVFTIGLFGIQHEVLTEEKKKTITTLYSLLQQSANHLDHLQDESHGLSRNGPHSTTFIAYWLRSEDYKSWKYTESVKKFWNELPDDAGVWREVMTVPKSRFMHASSQPVKSAMGHLLELKQSSDEGYWGVYRHRLAANPDQYTHADDKFISPYVTTAKAKPGPEKKVITIPRPQSTAIRSGRVRLSKVPENLLFAREGQRHPNISKDERDTWLESITPHAQSWMQHLDTEREKAGVLSFTTHLAHENPPTRTSAHAHNFNPTIDLETNTNAVAEANQLVYFLDLAHFEQAGRAHRSHVQLRKNTMEIYGPGGTMSEIGKAVLFVEICVLKAGDLDAEYIGCREGTGLMFLEDIDI
ncbi:hypothetical protein BLS_008161 [Venturia inaequalis]|uniref:Uncharacterized protein n=1 Tax=Venturia inaequalis TaxID=5025 RepID=A0A8H3Z4Z6_VENIN|nr:hypothetical protein BLS_008161 [Venturia inaequalis]